MKELLIKELKLTTSPLTFIFIAFAAMTFIPQYPILMGAFFICMGIFQSFQQTRVTNDFVYSSLLPIRKSDIVKSKYILTCFIQAIAFILIIIFSVIRLNASSSPGYAYSVLMNSNFVYLGFVLLIYVCFNLIFIGGFFKTADKITKPYLLFVLAALIIIMIGEALHFIPGLEFLNDIPGVQGGTVSTQASTTAQIIIFVICLAIYLAGTFFSYKRAVKKFEALNL